MSRNLIVISLIFVVWGCAVGNTYDYRTATLGLPITGSIDLGLAVVDARPYVLNGDKQSNFIGLQRGGFGNPFNVSTTSGDSLAADMQSALARSLENKGYMVKELMIESLDESIIARAIERDGSGLNAILILRDWKTDAMMSLALTYDVHLQIVDGENRVLAQTAANGDKEKLSGAGFEGQNARTAMQAFESKVSRLFNNPEIRAILNSE